MQETVECNWTTECTDAVRVYDKLLSEEGYSSQPLNVYDYLSWLNESDPTALDSVPRRS
jgi:hypothetical protein